MKDLKKKLTAATAMLVVSAVMLSGVSYAWYTLSTNPEVKGITATATSNASLEIAYNELATAPADSNTNAGTTGKSNTYGNLVTMESTNVADQDQAAWVGLNKELRPMTYTTDKGFQYMTYGTDGRPNMLDDLALLTAGNNNIDPCGNIQLAASNGKSAVNYGYYVRYWMRTNANGDNDIQLVTNEKRSNDSAAESGSTTITLTKTKDSTISEVSMQELVKHVRLGFYQAPTNNVEASRTGVTIVNPEEDKWNQTNEGSSTTLTLAQPKNIGVKLVQNVDTAVYMYVYLDGTTMGNVLADALANGNVTISVNTQFSNSGMIDTNGMTSTGSTQTNN